MNEPAFRAAEQRLWNANGATPRERQLHLQRIDADVRVQEVGDGPPVLFLHGANTSGLSWIALAGGLPDFRCLILDRPGTGLSARTARALAAALPNATVEVLRGAGHAPWLDELEHCTAATRAHLLA